MDGVVETVGIQERRDYPSGKDTGLFPTLLLHNMKDWNIFFSFSILLFPHSVLICAQD